MDRPSPLLQNRNFVLLWCAYTVSAFGDHLSEMALLDMQDAIGRPDSTRISAIMLFMFFLPFFCFSPIMGWFADRLPRKWIMIFADLVRAGLLFATVPLLGMLLTGFEGTWFQLPGHSRSGGPLFEPWVYAVPLFLLGLFAALFSPSRAAMLPTLIRQDQIVRANGLMNAMGPIAGIVSYLAGAKLVTKFGPEVCFGVDGVTFLVSASFIVLIAAPARRASRTISEGGARASGVLKQGWRYCRGHRHVIELITFTVLFWSAAGVIRSVMPALADGESNQGLDQIAYYNAALGLGLLAGAFLISAFGDALRSEIAISWSFVFVGLAVVSLSATLRLDLGFPARAACIFLAGMFGSGILVSVEALLQKTVPNFIRGRVYGIKDLASMGGLLLATGSLGVPTWRDIDRYVPMILGVLGVVIFLFGVRVTRIRLRRGRFGSVLTFWRNLTAFHNRLMARVRLDGICTIPASGGVIVAANHNSSLDPFLLISTSPNRSISFMIAREFAQIPLFARLVQMIDCIPVNRSGSDIASIKAALRHLSTGKVLGIFPQGRIESPEEPARVREGVGMLALRSGATVIPAYVGGVEYSKSVLKPFLRRQNAVVRYGTPVDLSAWKGREADRSAYREVAEHIFAQIQALRPPAAAGLSAPPDPRQENGPDCV